MAGAGGEVLDDLADVAGLGFEHVDDRTGADVGVRAVHQEQVGEVGDRHAQVGAGALGVPDVGEFAARAAVDVHGGEEFGALEAGAVDDDVDLVLDAVGGADTGRGDRLDGGGLHGDVGLAQRREVLVGEQAALTSGGVVWSELGAQLRIRNSLCAMTIRDSDHGALDAGDIGQRERHHLEEQPDREPLGPPARRKIAEQRVMERGVLGVELRQHPGGRPLEQRQVRGLGLNRRNVLDRTGSRADARDPLTCEIDVVIPFGGVERGAGEGVDARNIGQRRTRQLADRGDQHVRGEGVAVGGAHLPNTLVLIEFRVGDLGAEPDLLGQTVFRRHSAHVRVDVGLVRKAPGPIGFRLERPRVQRRGHIAGGVGVGVLPPHAAQIGGLLQDREIVQAVAL
ncbi:hypothetical protein NRB20_61840 [Nocardia sp. RB20]|uniref:Uncharacterized protein n=1 Tax=Nocardia macrotermitis TaxID=2585198 RepID=A0A7K0DBE9_9NOCA|nr:hypothetical protein [Nocardia macrotermitis]